MKKYAFHALVLLLLIIGMNDVMRAQAAPAQAQSQKEKKAGKLQSEAKISMLEARAIALKRAPGEVKESELEKEHGKLVYSFDIQQPDDKDITEVQVSAMDGSIVSVEKESAASQAAEKKKNAAQAKKEAAAKSQKAPPK